MIEDVLVSILSNYARHIVVITYLAWLMWLRNDNNVARVKWTICMLD